MRSAVLAGSLLLGCTLSGPAYGQVVTFPRPATEQTANTFLPAPRELRQHLARAEQALQEHRFSDTVQELGAILSSNEPADASESQDYFVVAPERRLAETSLRAEAQRLLGEMPSEGRELFELQYGGDARALLQQAIAQGDLQKLAEASRRFFHTQAGYEATLLLGRAQLDHGRPLAAALSFQRVAQSPSALAKYDPELSILLATCWLYSEMPEKARQTLLELKKRQPQAMFASDDRRISLFHNEDEALTWLQDLLGGYSGLKQGIARQWPLVGGNPTRNASSSGGIALRGHRWRVPTVNDPMDERSVRELQKQLAADKVASLPVIQPLAVQDVVLMRTPERLLAVDFQTGKRVWEFPWFESSFETPSSSSANVPFTGGGNPESVRSAQLSERLWDDAAHGQLASDGKNVYFLDELGYANRMGVSVMVQMQGFPRVNPDATRTHNRLVAVELASQGKLRWLVGGETGEDEPLLKQAFFLGAPLPLDGQLYAIVELNGEIRLVVLDAETGKLQWSQQLGHVDVLTIDQDQQRRLAGATPSFAEGTLICPTSAGAVVAVDIVTRSLRWGYQYKETDPYRHRFGISSSYRQQAQQAGQRWATSLATLAEGRVLLTPVESEKLYCLDIVTGKLLWERDRGNLLYIAAVHDGQVVLVGHGQITALAVATGKPSWKSPIDLQGAIPSGRGFYSGQAYFLPTSAAELLKIDLSEGRIVERTQVDHVLGNLICYGDQILSQGVDWLAAYYQLEPLRERVAKELSENAESAWALARQGELHLHDGNRAAALESLRKAHLLEPEDDTTRSLLVHTLLEALRDDFASNRRMAQEVEQLIDQPDQYADYLRLMGVGLREAGETEEAFSFFLKLVDETARTIETVEGTEPRMHASGQSLQVRQDRWLQGQIAQALESATAEERAAMDAVIQERLTAAVERDSVHALRQFLASFGVHPEADKVRLQLAWRLADAREWLEAELILLRLQESEKASLAAAATAELALLLQDAGRYLEAAEAFKELGERWPDAIARDGKTGAALLESAEAEETLQAAQRLSSAWPYGKVNVTSTNELSSSRHSQRGGLYPVESLQSDGFLPPGMRFLFDANRNQLMLRDGHGNEWQPIDLARDSGRRVSNPQLCRVRSVGHLVLLSTGLEVLAINAIPATYDTGLVDPVLWREDAGHAHFSPSRNSAQDKTVQAPWGHVQQIPVDAEGRPIGRFGPLSDAGVCFFQSRQLMCVDPLTGETLWVRDDVPSGSALFGDGELLFAVPSSSREASVYSMIDGRLLGVRSVEPEDRRWTTVGRNVLGWKQDDRDSLTLRLYDAWTGEEHWKRRFAAGSKGKVIENDEVAIVQPDGMLVILSLRAATPVLKTQVQPDTELDSVHVIRSRDRYLIATSHPYKGDEFEAQSAGPGNPMISGLLYAFDRQSGERLWQTPAAIEHYGMPLDQPTELPLLFFLRRVKTGEGDRPGAQSGVLMLDKRDGRSLLATDNVRPQSDVYRITADPTENLIHVELAAKHFLLQFTDNPLPPTPPAQTGARSSLYRPQDRVSAMSEAIFGALFRLKYLQTEVPGQREAPDR